MAADSQTKVNLAVRIANLLTGRPEPQELIKLVDAYRKLPGLKQVDFVGHTVRLSPEFYEYRAANTGTIEHPDGTITDKDMIVALTLSMFSDQITTLVTGYGSPTDDGLICQRGVHYLDDEFIDVSYFDPKKVIEVLK